MKWAVLLKRSSLDFTEVIYTGNYSACHALAKSVLYGVKGNEHIYGYTPHVQVLPIQQAEEQFPLEYTLGELLESQMGA